MLMQLGNFYKKVPFIIISIWFTSLNIINMCKIQIIFSLSVGEIIKIWPIMSQFLHILGALTGRSEASEEISL